MLNLQRLAKLAEPYEPRRPIADLIEELNRIYHSIEASQYRDTHPEIFEQLPPQWREMISKAQDLGQFRKWRILDFGCGTGFGALQVLKNVSHERIAALTCYDPSPEMLAECRQCISPIFSETRYLNALDQLLDGNGGYNLLLTNSLLHHLPDPTQTLKRLSPLLITNTVWIAGHEPSCRFYRNGECVSALRRYERERRLLRILQLKPLVHRLRGLLGRTHSVARDASVEAFRRGLFGLPPAALVVSRLVDAWVPHSPEEAAAGRGMDFQVMRQELQGTWSLEWLKTYAFMGRYCEPVLSGKWKRVHHELAMKYPNDGSSFSAVWRRTAC